MRKALVLLAVVALLSGVAVGGAAAADRIFVGIATGGTGGTYYPLGGMLAQLISNKAAVGGKKISATAETANASVANATLLSKGGIETAFVAADILDAAFKGIKQFKGKNLKNLRALGSLYPETVQFVVRGKADIKKFADIKGKSVSSGSPGSGQWQLLGDLLAVHGLDRKAVKEDFSSFAQAVEKIKDGNLDTTLITAGTPTASVSELANHHPIRILPLAGPMVDKLRKVQPYYTRTILKANTYKGQDKDVETIAVRAIWATQEKLSDDLAYAMVKALYENTDTLAKVHVKGKEISLKTALESISIPIHPGALRYYKEKGLVK